MNCYDVHHDDGESLTLRVHRGEKELDRRAELVGLLDQLAGPGILYARTAEQVGILFEWLRYLPASRGPDAEACTVARHDATVDEDARAESRAWFERGAVRLLVATEETAEELELAGANAGARFVVFYGEPASVTRVLDAVRMAASGVLQRCAVLLLEGEERS